ncbi:uncharacterized protein LOC141914496 [Tubulanus polymorphus]|uniref:uncharacterized protein LOC141914496 n=1 Tax=Tubulanus polymorphus TaxID=672921 RepID=UPI003DA5A778
MASAYIGSINEYSPQKEEWKNYQCRLEAWMRVNKISNESKTDVLLSMIGPETFELLVNLTMPKAPSDEKYEDLTALLEAHHKPPSTTMGERYKFNMRRQSSTETLSEYSVALKKLALSCEFGVSLEDQLRRNRFVAGIRSEPIRKKLLGSSKLVWKEACKDALAMETASLVSKQMSVGSTSNPSEGDVNMVKSRTENSVADTDNDYNTSFDDLYTVNGKTGNCKNVIKGYTAEIVKQETDDIFFRARPTPYALLDKVQPFSIWSQNISSYLEIYGQTTRIPQAAASQDDILLATVTAEEHVRLLREIFSRLRKHNVTASSSKSRFFVPEVEYLGHNADSEGIHPTSKNVEAIHAVPTPSSVSELRTYLGMLNHYGKFLPNLSTLLYPLHQFLKKDVKYVWSSECEKAFLESKRLLTSNQLLVHFDPKAELVLGCDASPYGLGAILSKKFPDGSEKPIAYGNRSLTPAECNYSPIEREALSIIYGIKHFHKYLYGKKFLLVTDHKPLVTIFGSKTGVPALAALRLQSENVHVNSSREDDVDNRQDDMPSVTVPVIPPVNTDLGTQQGLNPDVESGVRSSGDLVEVSDQPQAHSVPLTVRKSCRVSVHLRG